MDGRKLKSGTFNNGTPITKCDSFEAYVAIDSNQTPAFCYYDFQDANKANHGALYNEWATETGKLCPQGWHLPTNAEWNNLIEYAGDSNQAQLKLMATSGWTDDNGNNVYGTDDYGFAAKPSGQLQQISASEFKFRAMNKWAFWYNSPEEYGYYMLSSGWISHLNNSNISPSDANSVRCVKD